MRPIYSFLTVFIFWTIVMLYVRKMLWVPFWE